MQIDDKLMLNIVRLAQQLYDFNQKTPYNFFGNTAIGYLHHDILLAAGITDLRSANSLCKLILTGLQPADKM
jgi:hypothetical protein